MASDCLFNFTFIFSSSTHPKSFNWLPQLPSPFTLYRRCSYHPPVRRNDCRHFCDRAGQTGLALNVASILRWRQSHKTDVENMERTNKAEHSGRQASSLSKRYVHWITCQGIKVDYTLILRIFSCPKHQALSEVLLERAITLSQFSNLAGVPGSMGSKMHLDLRTPNGQLTDQSL